MIDTVDDLRDQSRTLSDQRITSLNKANSLRNKWQRQDAEADMLRANIEKWNVERSELERQKSEVESTLQTFADGIAEAERNIENLSDGFHITPPPLVFASLSNLFMK